LLGSLKKNPDLQVKKKSAKKQEIFHASKKKICKKHKKSFTQKNKKFAKNPSKATNGGDLFLSRILQLSKPSPWKIS